MTRTFRLASMEQYIIRHGTVSLTELTDNFNISINTVRRDLDMLESRGFVTKVYGGAMACKRDELVPSLVRSELNIEAKKRIGELASTVLEDNSTIYLDSGSTTPQVLPYLDKHRGISLLTNSLPAMVAASAIKELNLISFGGVYNHSTSSFVGQSVLNIIDTLTIHMAFMAATGVSIQNGMSNTTYFEAEIKRAICSKSRYIVLMADHTKFSKDALISYCSLEKLNVVVTDREPSAEFMRFFNSRGIKVLV